MVSGSIFIIVSMLLVMVSVVIHFINVNWNAPEFSIGFALLLTVIYVNFTLIGIYTLLTTHFDKNKEED